MAETPQDAGPPLVDPDEALQRAGGRPEVAGELFDILRATLPETATAIRDAHRASDLTRLRNVAHRLHGAALYCGVPRLRIEAAEVEKLCMAREHDRLAPTVRQLLETIEHINTLRDPLNESPDT